MIRIIYIITLLAFFFIGCEDFFKNDTVYGCLDEDACNYSSIANVNDSDLCDYPMENFNCDEECILEVDDCGVCNGDGLDEDQDGVCDDIDPCISNNTGYSNGYFCSDMHVLFDFISSNPSLDSSLITNGEIISSDGNTVGITDWEEGRLVKLNLPNLDLISVPTSIGSLNSLEQLFLNNNELNALPETLCDLSESCVIYVQDNNLCPQYHPDNSDVWDCIWSFDPQDCEDE